MKRIVIERNEERIIEDVQKAKDFLTKIESLVKFLKKSDYVVNHEDINKLLYGIPGSSTKSNIESFLLDNVATYKTEKFEQFGFTLKPEKLKELVQISPQHIDELSQLLNNFDRTELRFNALVQLNPQTQTPELTKDYLGTIENWHSIRATEFEANGFEIVKKLANALNEYNSSFIVSEYEIEGIKTKRTNGKTEYLPDFSIIKRLRQSQN